MQVANTPRHFTSDGDAAMTMIDNAVFHDQVFIRYSTVTPLLGLARFGGMDQVFSRV